MNYRKNNNIDNYSYMSAQKDLCCKYIANRERLKNTAIYHLTSNTEKMYDSTIETFLTSVLKEKYYWN